MLSALPLDIVSQRMKTNQGVNLQTLGILSSP